MAATRDLRAAELCVPVARTEAWSVGDLDLDPRGSRFLLSGERELRFAYPNLWAILYRSVEEQRNPPGLRYLRKLLHIATFAPQVHAHDAACIRSQRPSHRSRRERMAVLFDLAEHRNESNPPECVRRADERE